MHRLSSLSLVLILLTGLGPSCGPKCAQGYGVDQDGECVPFKHGEGDADTDADSDVGNPSDGDLEMIGEWTNENDESVIITSTTWTESVGDGQGSSLEMLFHIDDFWNDNNFLVARNDDNNDGEDGGLWSRFDWALDSSGAWVCPTACCAETKDEALNESAPNASDPSTDGCGIDDNPWSRLTRQ